ncbi:MAG: TIGR02921 family PEP-CTERM protein [Scytolyngbya sp. HA4215-MV1]|nr:TIGR02921 family PEP-CTERM protein [Scytolyngbya sp. HA4215-MV1]
MKRLINGIYHAIFWIWNLSFIALVYAGILPTIAGFLVSDFLIGRVPLNLMATLVALVIVPVVCTVIGLVRFRNHPLQLIRLFYGVEAPLFTLCLLRLFVFRELTPASTHILGTLMIATSAFGVELLAGYVTRTRSIANLGWNVLSWIQLVCHSIMLIIGVYTSILLLFYIIPFAAWLPLAFVGSFFSANSRNLVIPSELWSLARFTLIQASLITSLVLVLMLPGTARRKFWSLASLTVILDILAITSLGHDVFLSDRSQSWYQYDNPLPDWNAVSWGCLSISLIFTFALAVFTQYRQNFKVLRLLASFFMLGWCLIILAIENRYGILYPAILLMFGLTMSLFIGMPVLCSYYLQSWRRVFQAFAAQHGRSQAFVGSVATVTTWLVLFLALQQQPQTQAFGWLNHPPANDQARQTLLAKSDTIQKGLRNAYLSAYRYLSAEGDVNHIQVLYQSVFGLPESAARSLQAAYNLVMSPFLYQGEFSDRDKAAQLYAEFFDTPIQKAERQAINQALEATWNRGEAKAGLLNINQEKVWLREQKVTVKPQGDWADVELYEVYENQTANLQEVFYAFSLPESAVITGVWLGHTANLSDRNSFQVSPRGAAQKVYTEQVQERIDPALLEQVGPRHYRLRAFPVPAKQEARFATPTQLHLWLTYQVMQQKQGWALPQLAEQRNVYWTGQSQRSLNGQSIQTQAWLPDFAPAYPKAATIHQVNLPEGDSIVAKPLTDQDYALPQGQHIAVVLDTSRSMAKVESAVQQTFAWLQEQGFSDNNPTNNDADLYLAVAAQKPQRIDDLQPFKPTNLTFYGSLQLKDLLRQFDQQRGNTAYDAIVLLSDAGSYELSDDKTPVPTISIPLWIVHLGGMPAAYDDGILKTLQDSGGGVATELPEVLKRTATQAKLGSSTISVVDGYAWLLQPTPPATTKTQKPSVMDKVEPNNFTPVAARQFVTALSRQLHQTNSIDPVAQLDKIHAVAKHYGIVTPYSSMIVLINDDQRAALKRAEAAQDRFQREVETGQEQLTQPTNPLSVSAVPEPEEWVLILLGAIGLGAIARRRHLSNNSLKSQS